MNKIASTLCFLLISVSLFAQQLEGTYLEGKDVLKFENNNVFFDIEEMGSINNSVGQGTYERIGDYLLISADDFPGEKTMMQTLPPSKKDTIVIKVTNHANFPIQGALVEALSAKGKTVLGGTTNNGGRVLFLPDAKISQFRIFNMGFSGITFDYNPTNDFLVKMAERIVVENKQVAFKITEVDEETISVLLLSTDFEPGKDKQKALEKLNSKAVKRNFLPKRLKKEYIPYVKQTQN